MADAVLILSPARGRNRHVSDFRVEYANAAAAELADEQTAERLRPGALIGNRFLNLQGGAAIAVVAAFREVLSSDVPCAIDGLRYRVLRGGVPIDQVRDLRVSRHGERLLVTLRDVTAREQSEQGVRRSEKSLRALVDGVFDEALMIVDPTGNVLSWNTGAERIFGHKAHRMVGRHYSVLYPRGWPVASPVEDVETERSHTLHLKMSQTGISSGGHFWPSGSFMCGTTGAPNRSLRDGRKPLRTYFRIPTLAATLLMALTA